MSDLAPALQPARTAEASGWRVRPACIEEAPAIAAAVGELLLELGGKAKPADAVEQAARMVIADEQAGLLLVAVTEEGEVVGLLGTSWQMALRIPGRYGLIQEMWVHRDWRSRAVGSALLSTLVELAREQGVGRLEVGLPSERFAQLADTNAFYATNGFTAVGSRMRRSL